MKVDKIYFDMDGVLADFNRGIRVLCGMGPRPDDHDLGEKYDEEMWIRIKAVDHFYDKLELMPGAKLLFDAVYSKYGDSCEILTAIPKPSRGITTASDDKISWVRRLLSEDVKINIVARKEKKNFCKGEGSILIDDFNNTVRGWKENGGTAIHHKDPRDTLVELMDMGVL